jgi:hypothetical protein
VNYFVYAVCGGAEYLEQLNFSLKFLKYFSDFPIIVATDSSRNEIPIEHDNIVDIKTPEELSNHRAHLFIETNLPNYLKIDEKDVCCYLDSDVIAVSKNINEVFSHFQSPVTFAKDHCEIDVFSSKIMNCGCFKDFKEKAELFHKIISTLPQTEFNDKEIIINSHELNRYFNEFKTKPVKNIYRILKYLTFRYLNKDKEIYLGNYMFNRSNHCWYDESGNVINYDFNYYNKKIYREYGVKFKNGKWLDRNKRLIQPELHYCNHLRDYLKKEYSVNIPPNFRHWNGGVFLFSKQSKDFMSYWHKITLEESFKGKIKYYDDQATLVVSAFKFDTLKNKSLPIKYNFIADYNSTDTKWNSELGYTYNNFKTLYNPAFIHVYHHWGDEEWDIWQSVMHLGKKICVLK